MAITNTTAYPIPTNQVVLPASVRFDARLSFSARLLYGEIRVLCSKQGYCWAGNDYFAFLYQVQPKVVSRWIQQLQKNGYLKVDVKQGNRRRIFIISDLPKKEGPFPQKVDALHFSGDSDLLKSESQLPSYLYNNINDINEFINRNNRPFPSTQKGMENFENNSAVGESLSGESRASAPSPQVAAHPPSPKIDQQPQLKEARQTASTFIKPTLEQVEAYMLLQRELCTGQLYARAQALRFFNYYESNGWRVGRNPMLDWQAAANNWLLNAQSYPTSKPSSYDRLHIRQDKDYSIPL
jgi:hypothetical protein